MAIARSTSSKQQRIEEIQAVIRGRFPDSKFDVTPHPDARGVTAIWSYTSADPEELRALVRDREFEIMLEDGLHLLVIPMPFEDLRDEA